MNLSHIWKKARSNEICITVFFFSQSFLSCFVQLYPCTVQVNICSHILPHWHTLNIMWSSHWNHISDYWTGIAVLVNTEKLNSIYLSIRLWLINVFAFQFWSFFCIINFCVIQTLLKVNSLLMSKKCKWLQRRSLYCVLKWNSVSLSW